MTSVSPDAEEEVFHLMETFVDALPELGGADGDRVLANALQLSEHFQGRTSHSADEFQEQNARLFQLMKDGHDGLDLLKRWNAAVEDALSERVGAERRVPSGTPVVATLLCDLWAMDGARAFAIYSSPLLHKLSEVLRDAVLCKFQTDGSRDSAEQFVRGREQARAWVDFVKRLRKLVGERRIPTPKAGEHPMPSLLRAMAASVHLLSESTPTKNTTRLPGFSPDHVFHLQSAAEGVILALEARMQEQYGKSGSLYYVDTALRALIPLVVESPALTAKFGCGSQRCPTAKSADAAAKLAGDLMKRVAKFPDVVAIDGLEPEGLPEITDMDISFESVASPPVPARRRESGSGSVGDRRKSEVAQESIHYDDEYIRRDAPFLSFLQHVALYANERAEHRAFVVRVCCELLAREQEIIEKMEDRFPTLTSAFCTFLRDKLVRSKAQKHRVLVLETVTGILDTIYSQSTSVDGQEQGEDSESQRPLASQRVLFEILLSRMADKSPTVRGKALNGIAASLADNDRGREFVSMLEVNFAATLVQRCLDDSATVRKAAVTVCGKALGIFWKAGRKSFADDPSFYTKLLVSLTPACRDQSPSVRSCTATMLTEVLLCSLNIYKSKSMGEEATHKIWGIWMSGVLPLCFDTEVSTKAAAVNCSRRVFVTPLLDWLAQTCPLEPPTVNDASSDPHVKLLASIDADKGGFWNFLEYIFAISGTKQNLAAMFQLLCSGDGKGVLSRAEQNAVIDALKLAACVGLPGFFATTEDTKVSEIFTSKHPASVAAAWRLYVPDNDPVLLFKLGRYRHAAWGLLEPIFAASRLTGGQQSASKSVTFLIRSWRCLRDVESFALESDEETSDLMVEELRSNVDSVLRSISVFSGEVSGTDARVLADQALDDLLNLGASCDTLKASLELVCTLTMDKSPTKEAAEQITMGWIKQCLAACEEVLREVVYDEKQKELSPQLRLLAERAAFLVGELAMVGYVKDEDAPSTKGSQAATEGEGRKRDWLPRPEISPEAVDMLYFLLADESSDRTPNDSAEDSHEEPEDEVERTSESTPDSVRSLPSSLRAIALVSLGKLCVRYKEHASRSMNVLIQMVLRSSCEATRSNALLILADLCVRFTSLADPQLPIIARCLQDDSALVRTHAVVCITQLLLQDYLKLRGFLLHRLLCCVVDRDSKVRSLAKAALLGPLQQKSPDILCVAALEAPFVLNGATEQDAYRAAAVRGYSGGEHVNTDVGETDGDNDKPGSAVDMRGIHLEGSHNAFARGQIFRFCVDGLRAEQKLQLTGQLSSEVLGAVVDKTMKVSDHRQERAEEKPEDWVVRDACYLLSIATLSKTVCGRGRDNPGTSAMDVQVAVEESIEAEGGVATQTQVALALAKGRVLGKLGKRQLLQMVLPVCKAAKRSLEALRSPLQREVMSYLAQIFRVHKAELRRILDSDRTLREELNYEVAKWEKHHDAGSSLTDWQTIYEQPGGAAPLAPKKLIVEPDAGETAAAALEEAHTSDGLGSDVETTSQGPADVSALPDSPSANEENSHPNMDAAPSPTVKGGGMDSSCSASNESIREMCA